MEWASTTYRGKGCVEWTFPEGEFKISEMGITLFLAFYLDLRLKTISDDFSTSCYIDLISSHPILVKHESLQLHHRNTYV